MDKSFALLILDGWGFSTKTTGNAIYQAKTPHMDHLYQTYPHALINTHGTAVGLPPSQFGNSEIGHMSMSAGRVIPQTLSLIEQALTTSPAKHLQPMSDILPAHHNLHIMGLVSSGGVHSHINHTINLVHYIAHHFPRLNIYIHAFTDGRDTSTQAAISELVAIQALQSQYTNVHFASICGRYYAMDRDHNWERIRECYRMLTETSSDTKHPYQKVLKSCYDKNLSDEFIPPTQLPDFSPISQDDCILFTNFRSDRAIQLTQAFTELNTEPHCQKVNNFFSLTPYPKTNTTVQPIFKSPVVENHLGNVFAQHSLSQLRVAETEKYAHVTYFFNGGKTEKSPGESHVLIPSPQVASHDQQPEMSAKKVTEHIISCINKNSHDVIIANFANADMVGHTGNMQATIKAIETLDDCIGNIVESMKRNHWQGIITADHGNAETMSQGNQPATTHTLNPVPLISIGHRKHSLKPHGDITQVAPTILDLMGISPPDEMTKESLIRWS